MCQYSEDVVLCVLCDSGRRRLQRALQGIRLARVHQASTPRIPQDFKTIKTWRWIMMRHTTVFFYLMRLIQDQTGAVNVWWFLIKLKSVIREACKVCFCQLNEELQPAVHLLFITNHFKTVVMFMCSVQKVNEECCSDDWNRKNICLCSDQHDLCCCVISELWMFCFCDVWTSDVLHNLL